MMALAAMLLGTSCSNDELNEPVNGQPMTANFSVELPTGISARKVANGAKKAFADGKTATKLKYMVFDNEGKLIEGLGGEKDINLTATVQMQLTTGKEYKIVFWAANANAPYTLDDNGVVTVDYSKIKANDESLDAFYRCYDYKAGDDVENPIKLYRPFAQLNVGTNDSTAAASTSFNFAAAQTTVTVSGIANKLDLFTGEVSGDAEVTYAANAIPAATEKFPKAGYKYLSMDYLLVGKEEKSNVDVKWTATDGANTVNRTFANVPVQGNYRTNIYGALLTTTTDFNVQIEPAFNEPAYEYEVKDASELKAAIAAAGDANIKLTANVAGVNGLVIPVGKVVNIDLNGKTLSFDKAYNDVLNNYGNLTITNGTIKSALDYTVNWDPDRNYCTIATFAGSKLALENVNIYAPKALAAVVSNKNENNTSIQITKCNIVAGGYCVSTNAESEVEGVKVDIENSVLTSETPVMYNVPGTVSIKNSKLNGWRQCLIVRGGTAKVEGSEMQLTYDVEKGKVFEGFASESVAENKYMNPVADWGSGNNVPAAVIVLGTNKSTAYQYPTNLVMNGTKVIAKSFRAVVERNSGKNIVTSTKDAATTITGSWLKYNDATGKYVEVNK